MKWMVELQLRDGMTTVQEVIATNKGDAEYRAAYQAEEKLGKAVDHVIRTLPTR